MRKKVMSTLSVLFGLLTLLLIFSVMILLGLLSWRSIITIWGGM